jgi:hypothetical protein
MPAIFASLPWTRDWLSVEMMAVFERDFPPGWLPFVHSTPLS